MKRTKKSVTGEPEEPVTARSAELGSAVVKTKMQFESFCFVFCSFSFSCVVPITPLIWTVHFKARNRFRFVLFLVCFTFVFRIDLSDSEPGPVRVHSCRTFWTFSAPMRVFFFSPLVSLRWTKPPAVFLCLYWACVTVGEFDCLGLKDAVELSAATSLLCLHVLFLSVFVCRWNLLPVAIKPPLTGEDNYQRVEVTAHQMWCVDRFSCDDDEVTCDGAERRKIQRTYVEIISALVPWRRRSVLTGVRLWNTSAVRWEEAAPVDLGIYLQYAFFRPIRPLGSWWVMSLLLSSLASDGNGIVLRMERPDLEVVQTRDPNVSPRRDVSTRCQDGTLRNPSAGLDSEHGQIHQHRGQNPDRFWHAEVQQWASFIGLKSSDFCVSITVF